MLGRTAGIEEVLWNFTQFDDERCITLHDNPHFYSDLPTSFDAYTAQFEALPIDNFTPKPNATVYVVVDQPRRVFLETKHETRIFGNVFKSTLAQRDVMIFKSSSNVLFIHRDAFNISLDIHGALEGESVFAESIKCLAGFQRDEELLVVPDSIALAYDIRLWPIVTTNVTPKRTSQGLIELIRSALGPGDNDVRIYVGRLPQMWAARTEVSHNEPDPRILHIAHASIWHRFRRP